MGVASLGHRKRLLDAIAGLREEGPVRAPEAERRQAAVLFADLCSFTELSSTLGAEEMRRIVDRFLTRADELIVEHGGSVDKHIGDATMAVFGAPVAHEDDPLRAVAAAEAIQRAMPILSAELGRPATRRCSAISALPWAKSWRARSVGPCGGTTRCWATR